MQKRTGQDDKNLRDFELNGDQDIEASENELKGLAYTGMFLIVLLTLGVVGMCFLISNL